MRVSFDLSDADIKHFRGVMREVRKRAKSTSEASIIKSARSLLDEVAASKAPDFISERIAKLGDLIAMLEDEDWALGGKDRDRVVTGLAYFAEPEDMIPDSRAHVWREFFLGLVPPTILIAFALGSILSGWATPTEGAGMGAFGSIVLTMMYRKFTIAQTYKALKKTLEISVLILFLVAASNFFGAVFSRLGTPTMITEILLALDLSANMVVILILALVFILGWPLEWVPIVLIILPILAPVLIELGVDMLWFAILVAVCLQTAWLSPPVALSAYFLKGVVPSWDLKDIYLGMMQFMVLQLFGLAIVFLFPAIATWLPAYIYGQ